MNWPLDNKFNYKSSHHAVCASLHLILSSLLSSMLSCFQILGLTICSISVSAEEFCGSESIAAMVKTALWKRDKIKVPYYDSCKIISARYNCSRFQNSAYHYKIMLQSIRDINKKLCNIPDFPKLLKILSAKPTNIFMLGDSHMQQIFQSMLCVMKDRARNISTYEHRMPDRTMSRHVYSIYASVPECHSISYSSFKNFRLDEAFKSYKDSIGRTTCLLGYKPGQVACYYMSSTKWNKYSRICFSYVRQLIGHVAVREGMGTGLKNISLSVNNFDVVITNSYISVAPFAEFLKSANYKGRVIYVPRFKSANQSSVTLTHDVIPSVRIYDRDILNAVDPKFCSTFTKILGYSASPLIHCSYLNTIQLMIQRNIDSISSIFPITYLNVKTGVSMVCQEDQSSFNTCEGKDFRVCDTSSQRKDADQGSSRLSCNQDSHFCLPGPTDELARVVLAAAISFPNYEF